MTQKQATKWLYRAEAHWHTMLRQCRQQYRKQVREQMSMLTKDERALVRKTAKLVPERLVARETCGAIAFQGGKL